MYMMIIKKVRHDKVNNNISLVLNQTGHVLEIASAIGKLEIFTASYFML